jgi:hypothetical protein
MYLDKHWEDLKWDIIEEISYVSPDHEVSEYKTFAIKVDDCGKDIYFGVTLLYESAYDIIIYDVFDIELDMFLEFVKEKLWIKKE